MILNKTDRMQCPHCGGDLNGTVAEYLPEDAQPGSNECGFGQCDSCDEEYSVKLMDHAGNCLVRMS